VDFTLDEREQAVSDLATQILTDKITMERLAEIEAGDEWFDRDAWAALAASGLIGVAIDESHGGSGADLVSLGQLLRAQGATVAPIPLLPTTLAAAAIAELGGESLASDILPGVCDGSTILTIAVQEYLDDDLATPAAEVSDGAITGQKIVVEYADLADHMLVSAVADGRSGLYLVQPGDAGVMLTEGLSSRLEPVWQVDMAHAPCVEVTSADGAVGWLVERMRAGLCAIQLGVTEAALKLTAEYTTERQQFGRPVATFQAVTQRLADQYINVAGIRLTTYSALWRLSHGVDATEEVSIAKWWASERASAVAHASQHCHGGMGVSVEYPLHRYTLWNKHLTTSLGAGTRQLREIGARLAAP